MTSTSIIDQLKKEKILGLLDQGKRIDGRSFDQVRDLHVDLNVIPKANGSARVRLGYSDVICGIKIQPDKPFPDMGDKGIFICTAELLPISHHTVETGPPGEAVIELARVVDRGIRESHMIDLSQLVIEKDKSVIGVFADNTVVDYDGNLFDACSYATTAAILSSITPKWEIPATNNDGNNNNTPILVEGKESKVPVTTIPISITMGKIANHIIVDPNGDEWSCMDARLTITTDSDGNICALQKGGSGGFTFDELIQCGNTAIKAGSSIRDIIKKAKEQIK